MQHKNTPIDNSDLTKAESHIIVEIIQYIPNAVLSRTIIKKLPETLQLYHLMQVKNYQKEHLLLTTTYK